MNSALLLKVFKSVAIDRLNMDLLRYTARFLFYPSNFRNDARHAAGCLVKTSPAMQEQFNVSGSSYHLSDQACETSQVGTFTHSPTSKTSHAKEGSVGGIIKSDDEGGEWDTANFEEESCSEPQSVEDSDTVHQAKEPELQVTSKPNKTHECLSCGKVFPRSCDLRRHLVIHSGNRPYRCRICGRGFTQSGNLKTHMKVHRGHKHVEVKVSGTSRKPEEPPVPMHVCGDCGMDFALKKLLDKHKMIHKEQKPFFCSDCGKSFKCEYYFKLHRRGHAEDWPFLCSKCGKGFVTLNALKHHEVTHKEERNYSCGQCGKAFKQAWDLLMHRRTHTGERSHLCSICGKSYSSSYCLKVHVRVHTGERPYACQKCGRSFTYSQGINAHLKTHDKKPKKQIKPLGRPKRLLINYY